MVEIWPPSLNLSAEFLFLDRLLFFSPFLGAFLKMTSFFYFLCYCATEDLGPGFFFLPFLQIFSANVFLLSSE